MDAVREVAQRPGQTDTGQKYRALRLDFHPAAHVAMHRFQDYLTVTVYDLSDDDLRKIQYACGEGQ